MFASARPEQVTSNSSAPLLPDDKTSSSDLPHGALDEVTQPPEVLAAPPERARGPGPPRACGCQALSAARPARGHWCGLPGRAQVLPAAWLSMQTFGPAPST